MTNNSIVIIGAGIAGSIAYRALSSYNPLIFDASPQKPVFNDHHAVMRVRNPDIAKYLGCNLKEIMVRKSVLSGDSLQDTATITDNNLYSIKTHNSIDYRSLKELGWVKRYLLEGDYISADCQYNQKLISVKDHTLHFASGLNIEYDICISTIPMSILLKTVGIKKTGLAFKARPIFVAKTKIIDFESNVHQTIYIPDLKYKTYRATLEGNQIIFESVSPYQSTTELNSLLLLFGLNEQLVSEFTMHEQKFGKLMPIDDIKRQSFILMFTDTFDIYSLGRYSVWRPDLRIDHLIKDIEQIKKMVVIKETERRHYASRLD